MARGYQYVGECVRLSGGEGAVFASTGNETCGGCGTRLLPGSEFSVGEFASDQAMCRECEPFDVQGCLVDGMEAPSRGRSRRPPTAARVSHYTGRDGGGRHASECESCNGKGGSRIAGLGLKEKWVSCRACRGSGVIWNLDSAGVE